MTKDPQLLIDALDKIAYTVKHLQDEARASGGQLDGIAAFQIANDPRYLKKIAAEALASYAGSAEGEKEYSDMDKSRVLREATSLLDIVHEYTQHHTDIKVGDSMVRFTVERAKKYDELIAKEPEKKDPWIKLLMDYVNKELKYLSEINRTHFGEGQYSVFKRVAEYFPSAATNQEEIKK